MRVVMISRWNGVRPGAAKALGEYAAAASGFWQRMQDSGTVEWRQEYAPAQRQGGLNVTVFPDRQRFNDLLADPEWMKVVTTAGLLLEGYEWEQYIPQDELPEGFMAWWFEQARSVG
jgi:hypothetical protein